MSGIHSPTVVHAFTTLTHADATRPLMTFYDDGTGERTELSGATLANWVAKTANLLVDGVGLGPGAVAAVRLPAHWQTAAILLGCWSAGLAVDLTATDGAADVAFVTADTVGTVGADETYALALTPLGMPFRPGPPLGTLDYSVEVRGHGDHFNAPAPAPGQAALADGTTHADLVATVTAAMKVSPAARVLIDGDRYADPLTWLFTPLLAGSSIVLCRHLDPAQLPARLQAEHATVFP